ncbi:MAG: UDP-N-acetylmuramoyl-L-alanyl-D-glutamate--2,6-diaminopimelate ligase [Clostridiales Family XIII bacterium]|jgi:UDP-N-acetylmuramoyl-L-alanyl-D-glutamate--2,6-diaminopimelate ligase|nr:UDP-N-acetylmuramoyl-L-alanyl-D-glutamate--2,6-diaminopimelate ligase [Clostridiales Family XIII bacterium]
MKLRDLLHEINHRFVRGDENAPISGIAIDSRLVKRGDLFVAIAGREADGHEFIPQAVENGAAAILVANGWAFGGDAPGDLSSGDASYDRGFGGASGASASFSVVSVPDTRVILSKIVNRFHGEPSRKFTLVGVTGTNGKTSVATLINHIWVKAGRRTGLLGTIENYCLGEVMEVRRTTPTNPDCVELGDIMSRMADRGVDYLVMEATSMGLKMGRVGSCDFDVAVFTNLSPEHLDDHGGMEDYKASKIKLFELAKSAVVNADDPASGEFIAHAKGSVIRYGVNGGASGCDLYAEGLEYSPDGVSFDLVSRETEIEGMPDVPDAGFSESGKPARRGDIPAGERARVNLSTPAPFAVYNALAAAAACVATGVSFKDVAAALNEPVEIPGRYEVVTSEDGVAVVVDYAHTEKALENLLEAVRSNPSYGRLISVFGCGGDRDPGKRAPMGEISGRLADYTIITSDNPRTEDPAAIIARIEEGIKPTGGAYETEPDRAKAVERAILSAKSGDVVVVAGKGHEDYQIIGREKVHLDDRETAEAALKRRNADENRKVAARFPHEFSEQA